MKIAYIVPGLDPTGPIFVVQSLVSSLVEMNYSVIVYYLNNRDTEIKFKCETKLLDKKKCINFSQYDIVHTHCFSADKYVYTNRKKLGKAKWVSTIHQDTIASFKFKYPTIIATLLGKYWLHMQNHADGIVAISNQVKNIHQPYISNNIHTIYNGINTEIDIIDSERRAYINKSIKRIKDTGKNIIGTYANIVKRKGLDQVIDCMVLNDNFCFVIIGEGEYKSVLQQRVNDLGLSDRVYFFPFVASPYACLENIDAYIMPSYSEGFGLALLESAYVGKPIICSDLPSFNELFTDSEAVYFKLNDIESLSHAINEALANGDKYSKKSQSKASLFSKKNMAKKHLELYSTIQSNINEK